MNLVAGNPSRGVLKDLSELLEFPEGNHGYNGYKGKEWDAWQKRCVEWLAETFKMKI